MGPAFHLPHSLNGSQDGQKGNLCRLDLGLSLEVSPHVPCLQLDTGRCVSHQERGPEPFPATERSGSPGIRGNFFQVLEGLTGQTSKQTPPGRLSKTADTDPIELLWEES